MELKVADIEVGTRGVRGRIHSMELKAHSTSSRPRPLALLENPFNGIESSPRLFRLQPILNSSPKNPFNGIERYRCSYNVILVKAFSANPFNGIERWLVTTRRVCDSSLPSNPFNGIESSRLEHLYYHLIDLGIHSMELKAKHMSSSTIVMLSLCSESIQWN